MRMAKSVKCHGRVYTPSYIVNLILDFGGYNDNGILQKHVIDNSCGDGAFLVEIARRYCTEFLKNSNDLSLLKSELQTYIHGIELEAIECQICVLNLNCVAKTFGLENINWDVRNADTLTIDVYNGRMDFVFGNPPYVRVHNLECSYEAVKKYRFANYGMTDLYIVFFEIGFRMMSGIGQMCLITPSSWLNSIAGKQLREYIMLCKNLSGVIDLEHFQPFDATTYTLISRFSNANKFNHIEYFTFDKYILNKRFVENVPLVNIQICQNFYLSAKEKLELLYRIKSTHVYRYVSVKNGFATLADKVFIGDFDFHEGTIKVLKASTGKWSKCIYPYNEEGKPMEPEGLMKLEGAYNQLLLHREKLNATKDANGDKYWYLFGRTQAIKDVSKNKYAINTIIKDLQSIKIEYVPCGCGGYSGLYILTEIEFEIIKQILCSEHFIEYIRLLKNYKSGGYFTFSSKDLEQYLNYQLTLIYGQSRISNGSRELF